jgi:hypothetical protein
MIQRIIHAKFSKNGLANMRVHFWSVLMGWQSRKQDDLLAHAKINAPRLRD